MQQARQLAYQNPARGAASDGAWSPPNRVPEHGNGLCRYRNDGEATQAPAWRVPRLPATSSETPQRSQGRSSRPARCRRDHGIDN
jgi:hypothetical protein